MIKSWNWLVSKIDTPLWLEMFFAILVILRIPSFFEPYYYGDEMIYMTLGHGIRQGIPLYLGLHDNKPPLLYLTAAVSSNLFIFKVLLALFSLISVYLFWKLIRELFIKNEKLQKVATVLFGIFTTIPLLEGNIANAENFMIVPTLLGLYLAYKNRDDLRKIFFGGILIAIASLFKIVAAFDILAIVVFWLIYTKKTDFWQFVKKLAILSTAFFIPHLISFFWFYLNGSFNQYLTAAFKQNFGYVSSWRPQDVAKPFLERNLPLLVRFSIMIFGFIVLWLFKNKLSKQFVFVSGWLLATLFAVTLSERPYPHYLLQSVTPAAILFGMLFTNKNIEQILAIIPLALFAFVPYYFKFWYYPTTPYYSNFLKFAVQKIDKSEYFDYFSKNVNRNYKIAEFLKTSSQKNDKIFVWSNDSSAVYSLSRRLPPTKYVADYHFIDFSTKDETLSALNKNKPKFVIITDNSYPFPELYGFLEGNYYIITEINDSQIWLLIKR